METAHPDRKAGFDFDQARPAIYFACDVRTPVLDELYDPFVGDADIDGSLDFVLVHELSPAGNRHTCRPSRASCDCRHRPGTLLRLEADFWLLSKRG